MKLKWSFELLLDKAKSLEHDQCSVDCSSSTSSDSDSEFEEMKHNSFLVLFCITFDNNLYLVLFIILYFTCTRV